jgi:hypothetical protein
MSDRLTLAHAIEDAGIPREKAENVAAAIVRFVEGSAATRADVERVEASLKAEIARAETAMRAEIVGMRRAETALRSEIVGVRSALATETARQDTRIERLDAKIEQVGSRTFNRLVALMAVIAGLLFAALHLWPPH